MLTLRVVGYPRRSYLELILNQSMPTLIIHGHFYQPPRENPWTGVVDAEPSAQPFHDWNERITSECYEPNSAVRIVDEGAGTETFVNNYAHLSFDFGPTLLSWLAREHPNTYARIIAADAESASRRNGHGNAIAQAYSHAILPLCNERDRRTQVRWGMADFRFRFGRAPEALWLPETACNDDVLGLLIDEGLRFVILAPQQAQRVRRHVDEDSGKPDWQSVTGAEVDTSIGYRYLHRDGSGRSIAVFFYDQQLAGAIAFDQALASSASLADLFAKAKAGAGDLINVATDGESYGHHYKFGDLCLAYAFAAEIPARKFSVTNYGEYLDRHSPSMEVEISNGLTGEGSSWSCVHGVDRWARDCGCSTGGDTAWNQEWRRPLRKALDFLRDEAALHFEGTRGKLFTDPWNARDDAIELVLNESKLDEFLRAHAPRDLGHDEQQQAMLFLELQRNALLMYASCAWFFNDISGVEPVQILKYAARAIDLMDQLGLPSPRNKFLEILSEAKSNRPEMGTGADIYRRLVEPTNPRFKIQNGEPAARIA